MISYCARRARSGRQNPGRRRSICGRARVRRPCSPWARCSGRRDCRCPMADLTSSQVQYTLATVPSSARVGTGPSLCPVTESTPVPFGVGDRARILLHEAQPEARGERQVGKLKSGTLFGEDDVRQWRAGRACFDRRSPNAPRPDCSAPPSRWRACRSSAWRR